MSKPLTQGELLDLLVEMSDFLDNYVDVVDGDDGEPRPNRAMSLKSDVDRAIERMEASRSAHVINAVMGKQS